MMLLILASILLVCCGIFILHMHRSIFELVAGWGCILFFGCCGILMLYSLLKERLFDQPHLTITDEGFCYRRYKTMHVRFADVESFKVRKVYGQDFIAINYKPDVERQKMQDASIFGYLFRSMNKRLIDAQDSISAAAMSMKTDELCQLLNQRLKRI